eukprot:2453496-Rhodomonas_salina.1
MPCCRYLASTISEHMPCCPYLASTISEHMPCCRYLASTTSEHMPCCPYLASTISSKLRAHIPVVERLSKDGLGVNRREGYPGLRPSLLLLLLLVELTPEPSPFSRVSPNSDSSDVTRIRAMHDATARKGGYAGPNRGGIRAWRLLKEAMDRNPPNEILGCAPNCPS